MLSKRYFHQDIMRGPLSTHDALTPAASGRGLPQEPTPDLGQLWTGVMRGLEKMRPDDRKQAIDQLHTELGRAGWWSSELGITTPNTPSNVYDSGPIAGIMRDERGRATRVADDAALRRAGQADVRDVNATANQRARDFWAAQLDAVGNVS